MYLLAADKTKCGKLEKKTAKYRCTMLKRHFSHLLAKAVNKPELFSVTMADHIFIPQGLLALKERGVLRKLQKRSTHGICR